MCKGETAKTQELAPQVRDFFSCHTSSSFFLILGFLDMIYFTVLYNCLTAIPNQNKVDLKRVKKQVLFSMGIAIEKK